MGVTMSRVGPDGTGDEFDERRLRPYLKWFGISPAVRPINHYRLLGIEVFEPIRK